MIVVFVIALLGCKTTALHSTVVPGLWLQRVHDAGTTQPCLDAPELLRCAEAMALVLLQRAAGYSGSWGKPSVCLIEHQEPCCVGARCAESTPGREHEPRAGCTYENASWIARRSAEGQPYDYSSTLEDELRHSIANMLSIPTTARHTTAWDLAPSTGVRCNWRR